MASVPPAVAELFSTTGKTAIVTGGTGGLGLSMAVALAESGANIVSIQLPNDPQAKELENEVKAHKRTFQSFDCDVSNSKDLRACFSKIWDEGVRADILLNCAGIQRRGKAEELDDEAIEAVWNINLKATFVAGQEVAKRWIAKGQKGKIINVASIISFIANTDIAAYAASKGGVMQTTKAFSNEWAKHGVQVNAICPGYMKTPLTAQYSEDPKYKGYNDYIIGRTPAARWGEPHDLRGAVIFLASPASDYVTGTSIVVDGGLLAK